MAVGDSPPGVGGLRRRRAGTAKKSAAEFVESGKALLGRGEPDQALVEFDNALAQQADSAPAREGRAAAFLQLKRYDHAKYDCDEALKIDGKLASAYFIRGQIEKNLGETEKALEDYAKAIDNGLGGIDALMARGGLYCAQAKAAARPDETAKLLQKAIQDLDRAVKLDSRNPGLRMQRATIHLELGDYENAVADCDVAIEADPNLAAAYVARARGESESGELDNAVRDCDSAIHLDGGLIEAYVVRAKARLEKSAEMRTPSEVAECELAADDCQKAFELAKKLKGESEETRRAEVAARLGRTSSAEPCTRTCGCRRRPWPSSTRRSRWILISSAQWSAALPRGPTTKTTAAR